MKRKDKRDGDADEGTAEEFEVGYCKPPKANRFKPGTSGNPRGRPPGSHSRGSKAASYDKMKKMALQEASRSIQIRDGDQLVKMPIYQAAMRSLGLQSAAGKVGSQRLFFELIGDLQQEDRRNAQKLFAEVVDYKREGEAEIIRRHRLGLPELIMIPHPDHLIVEPMTGRVILRGPFDPDEKAIVDRLLEARASQVAKIQELECQRRSPGNSEMIACCKRVIEYIDTRMPPDRILVEDSGG